MADVTSSIPAVPRNQRATTSGPVIPTPTYGTREWFTVSCSVHIDAPPNVVLEVLLDHANWAVWNRLVRRNVVVSQPLAGTSSSPVPFTGPKYLSPGTEMLCEVHLDLSPKSKPRIEPERVTIVEQLSSSNPQWGWRVAWVTTGMPRFLLGIERI